MNMNYTPIFHRKQHPLVNMTEWTEIDEGKKYPQRCSPQRTNIF